MAKLSEDVLEQGRKTVRETDLEGLLLWVKVNAPLMDEDIIQSTFVKVFAMRDTKKALKMFDAGFVDYDPTQEVLRVVLKLGMLLLVTLGAIGGVVYLVRSCTGL